MASNRAVAESLALLAADRGGEISPLKVESWALALSEISDDELRSAVAQFLVLDTGDFVPSVAKIYALCRPPKPIDTEAMLYRISELGSHNPNIGWMYPSIDTIRRTLGDGIADAYAAAGASRCFAPESNGSTVTRDIARQAFAKGVKMTQGTNPTALAAPDAPALLASGISHA